MALEIVFQEIASLATTGERHTPYICNTNYCDMIERIELSIQSSH